MKEKKQPQEASHDREGLIDNKMQLKDDKPLDNRNPTLHWKRGRTKANIGVKRVVICRECGKECRGHVNKSGIWVNAWKVLAGHIMASRDHSRKRWAKELLLNAHVGTGLWGDTT